jgi:hypothetical protein
LGCHREKGAAAAIDGKTIRDGKRRSRKAYHVVSAFAEESQIVPGELAATRKSNEISASPEPLDTLNAAGRIVAADAMSYQKRIVRKIQTSQADYVIGLKGNRPALPEEASLYFRKFSRELHSLVTGNTDHGRIEKREYRPHTKRHPAVLHQSQTKQMHQEYRPLWQRPP